MKLDCNVNLETQLEQQVLKYNIMNDKKTVKARLTVKGYEDMAVDLSTFSVTTSCWD